jgi:hypothetical protein
VKWICESIVFHGENVLDTLNPPAYTTAFFLSAKRKVLFANLSSAFFLRLQLGIRARGPSTGELQNYYTFKTNKTKHWELQNYALRQ